ncbi:CoA transferase [Paucilactobacillus hokkaidonensis JCM 18461]|uniref:CoA transferase n=2 Tax=Paucilactobacillus hokkaidonensis TaxID=1193095 RepID=A0A0A1H1D3_9LACO|nr:CoA-transferase [Paucilactobacillus hokkaidonensis]KRO11101.1 propionate CoA-transferase [Paucilactobacillus hokkaidonensis]BAP86536.1 CoA transferase [Paucilactobacillus hokkaidonensis JCM 18461]
MSVEFIDSESVISKIPDGATIALEGFLGSDVPEEILEKLHAVYLKTGHPKNLTFYHASGIGDGKERGTNNLAEPGMVKRIVGGHWALAPKLEPLVEANQIEAYCFPQGVLSQIFRDSAAHKPLHITRVGLGTFIDPDLQGGKLNLAAKEDLVSKMQIKGKDYLAYEVPKPNIALLRGSYADEDGNITFEDEPLTLESTAIAMAAHNNGGKVIVSVKRIVDRGSMKPKDIRIPGLLVDYVCETDDATMTQQSTDTMYNPDFVKASVIRAEGAINVPLDIKKVIARRAAMFLQPEDRVVNYGIGKYPETVSLVLKEEKAADNIITTVEPGTFGGVPLGGGDFGCAISPQSTIDQPYMFDFYDGGGIDTTFLGLAELDQKGNINVSKFGPKIAGVGGFVNITQNTKTTVFTGTFTAGGFRADIENGELHITKEGKSDKLVKDVEQVTFSGHVAHENGQHVYYVTERAVFELVDDGIELIEIAPGIDLQKDVLSHMGFKPNISDDLKYMDARIFAPEKMGDIINKADKSVGVTN